MAQKKFTVEVTHTVDLSAMASGDGIWWSDPTTGEERFTPTGDPMYSTASMFVVDYQVGGKRI